MISALLAVALSLSVPNAAITPGVTRPITVEVLCATKWGKDVRHVTEKMKREIAASYGLKRAQVVPRGKGPCCEYDHKLPRELGGADAIENIWPQSWVSAGLKDIEENRWHKDVCSGRVSLADAQQHFLRWGQR